MAMVHTRHMSRRHTTQNIAHRDIAQLVRQLWVPEYEQALVTQSHPMGAALVRVCMPNEAQTNARCMSVKSIQCMHALHAQCGPPLCALSLRCSLTIMSASAPLPRHVLTAHRLFWKIEIEGVCDGAICYLMGGGGGHYMGIPIW